MKKLIGEREREREREREKESHANERTSSRNDESKYEKRKQGKE
jgi:hypothetical protein